MKYKFHSYSERVVMAVGIASLLFLWGCASSTEINPSTSTPTFTDTDTPSLTESPVSASSTASSTSVNSQTQISEKDGMPLVYVPAGKFIMGNADGDADEQPAHEVALDAFWIDKTEVTNVMYAGCVSAGECNPPSSTGSSARENYFGNPEYDNYPVIFVSWNDANTYCQWAGRRLPTEAEWERAARGDTNRLYPWGNETPSILLLNYNNTLGDTSIVGNYPGGASPYGALDMAGNVWEWVADWYDSEHYANSPERNPSGPESGEYRVLRGGSWEEGRVRSSYRNEGSPSAGGDNIGFRCAVSAAQ